LNRECQLTGNPLFHCQTPVLLVAVVEDLIGVGRMVDDVLGNVDEFDPLFFRGGVPTGESTLVEGADDEI
jgi:hypothetical protein